jgi:alcohol dehydrogenase (cytochrome c)
VAAAEGCSAGTSIKTPMDENRDWVGQRMCCFEQGRTNVHGSLWAVDVRTGKVIAKERFPLPNESGLLSTGGDLLFSGHHTGHFAAYDSDTLKKAWSFDLGTPITAPPMTYSVNGKQYIAVVAGGAGDMRGARLYQPAAVIAVFGL